MKFGKITLAGLFVAACCVVAVNAQCAEATPAPQYQIKPYGQQYTPDQLEQARKIFNDSYAGMAGTRQALNERQYQLDRELSSPNPDKGRIEALSQEIGKLRGEMLSARTQLRNNLSKQGLPPDYYGYGPMMDGYGPMMMGGYGPCWGGDDGYGRGYYHHGRGHHGGRRGCWW